jgi:hypothetical protein
MIYLTMMLEVENVGRRNLGPSVYAFRYISSYKLFEIGTVLRIKRA